MLQTIHSILAVPSNVRNIFTSTKGSSHTLIVPEAKLVQELRALEKLHGTYLEVGIDKDDRIRSSWNPRGTKFGRFSSSKTIFGSGMNLQNLHPEFKEFLVSDND